MKALASKAATGIGWALGLAVFAASPASATESASGPQPLDAARGCVGLVPSPWPATLVERRLHLRRMEAARLQCIGHAGFLAAFGALWLEEEEPEQARVWLERSLMLDPANPGALADHALALAALGEPTALKELALAWRSRTDVPPALRERISVALEPGATLRLPIPRLGERLSAPRRASRGEASVLVGYDNNLAISPRLTELTLTPPEGPIVLPVISTPRRGGALRTDLSWQTAWAPSAHQVARIGISMAARSAPGHSSTDWHQFQGSVNFTQQWDGWSLSGQGDAVWFGGALTEPYALARARLQLAHAGENCSQAAQVELDGRRQTETRSADSLTTLLAWRLQCRPFDRRDWQWGLTLRGGVDRPERDLRPGGVQRSLGAVLRLEHRPTALTAIDLSLGTLKLDDSEGYSPLLENNAVRTQRQSFVVAEVSHALDLDAMPGAEAVFQITRFRQTSNLALFRHEGTNAYIGLRWPW